MTTNAAAYFLFLSGSILCCYFLYMLAIRKRCRTSFGETAVFSLISMLLSVALGLAGAKLLYFAFRFTYILKSGVWGYLFSLKASELSFCGAACGVCLAVYLTAKWTGRKPADALNAFAFPGALLAAAARFAEYWLGSLGTGSYIEEPLAFPFAVQEVWNPDFPEYYLAVFMLTGVLYLRVAVFALQKRDDPLCFVRTVFCLCLSQTICESMRAQSIRWLFVRYEQLFCYLICEGILVAYAVIGARQGRKNWYAAVLGVIVAAAVIAEEFMLDGKLILLGGIPTVVIYAMMAWELLELAGAERAARGRLEIGPGAGKGRRN